MKLLDSFLEIAGSLGFLVGDNDRRRERARTERYSWGDEIEGLQISLAVDRLDLRPDESLLIEIALRNAGSQSREVNVGSWLLFFPLEIADDKGQPTELSSFGRHQMEAARAVPDQVHRVAPGGILQAKIPAGALFQLSTPGTYKIRGHSAAGHAVSNEIQIRI